MKTLLKLLTLSAVLPMSLFAQVNPIRIDVFTPIKMLWLTSNNTGTIERYFYMSSYLCNGVWDYDRLNKDLLECWRISRDRHYVFVFEWDYDRMMQVYPGGVDVFDSERTIKKIFIDKKS